MWGRALRAVIAAFSVVLLGTLGPAYAVDPTDTATPAPTATATETVTATATETATTTTTETATATATVTADPTSRPLGDHEARTGYRVDPVTGDLIVTQGSGVGLAVLVWIGCVVAGLATAWLVLP